MPVEVYEWCPFCIEGQVFNENRSILEPCPVCKGHSVLTPDNICNCGLPCLSEKEGIPFCGTEGCFVALKASKTWDDRIQHVIDEADDTDFPTEIGRAHV